MKRKSFLASLLPAALSFSALSQGLEMPGLFPVIPASLKPGDCIGITAPAGYITAEDVQPALKKLQEWGFRVKAGNTIGKRDFTFGGTDDERRADLQSMLDDNRITAILCARGGYGMVRIIDKLDFKQFAKNPKWVIGFSDITVLHSHIHRNYNIATIHSKMCNSFPADWSTAEQVQIDSIESIRDCLTGKKMSYQTPANSRNRLGSGTGILVGGNLKTIESLAASASDINTRDKILFVEDTGEYLYSIDRMFWNLQRTGKLAGLKGLIVGGFKEKKDDPGEEFGKTLEKIVLEKLSAWHYPVCFDFPVGHQKNNVALKCGVSHTLDVNLNGAVLTES